MTDPNWEPVMKRAAAIVTNRGGRTCHAAIIARELGIPAIVGSGDATARLRDGDEVTVSCAEGDTGNVYAGRLPFEVTTQAVGELPRIPVKISMNVGNPQLAFDHAALPNAGVGLARLEFVINNMIGVHPKAVLDYPDLPGELKRQVEEARGYASRAHSSWRSWPRAWRPSRRLLAETGDRAALRLQVERVPQARGRCALRTGGGEPDARVPRRLALHRPGVPRVLRP
jgi:phosphoenolpyruvate synthase/pyruvate phosphate dikinase